MTALLENLRQAGRIHPPPWLIDNTILLAKSGSHAYGCAEPDSDADYAGITVPPKEIVFPHLTGHIPGFGPKPPAFSQWQEDRVTDPASGILHDFAIYGLPRFMGLCAEQNPNLVDALFTPPECILHASPVAQHLIEHRRDFLHKGCHGRFMGYARSQMAKLRTSNPANERRAASVARHGYDVKAAYHLVRLGLECTQILTTGDLILDRDAALYRKIRAGEWPLERVEEWFAGLAPHLESIKSESALPDRPDWPKLRNLLADCLELHYGSMGESIDLWRAEPSDHGSPSP